jgi:hypothetical protein
VAGEGETAPAMNRHWSKLPSARSGDKSVALKLLIVSPSETGPSAEPNDRTFIGSSIFLCFFLSIVRSIFMWVNSWCAH